jgi:uncharacterized protein
VGYGSRDDTGGHEGINAMDRLSFPSDGGIELEGEIRRPDGPPLGSAVLCHPHPLFGGSKDHPILWAVRSALARLDLAVLSFNFRGVMGSGGTHGGGGGETADCRAAIDCVRDHADGPTFLFGWSFGANVALRVTVEDERVAALALCGVPLDGHGRDLPPLPGDDRLARLDRPVLICVGGADEISPLDRARDLAARIPGAELAEFRAAGHYFPGRERELAERVGAFARTALLRPQ